METVRTISKTEALVEQLLEESEPARNSDYYLFALICCKLTNKAPSQITLMDVADNRRIPKYETVTRVRRRLQAERPELAGTRAKAARTKQEAIFKEYSRS